MSSNPLPPSFEAPENDPQNPPPLAAHELLPPVEPPSASFIIQLFVVPAVIVVIVVMIGWLVTAMATTGNRDPQEIVATLRSSSQTRWQEAFELANSLRTDKDNQLKTNTVLADELAKLLAEEHKAARPDDDSVKLRSFLCAALGAFHVDNGLPVLLDVAANDVDETVRGHAINAIAVLSEEFRTADPPRTLASDKLVGTFVELARDKSDMVRSQTAYALGVLTLAPDADPQLMKALEELAEDLYPDARYNAATGLARQGSLLAVAPLVEMLDLESLATSIKGEARPEMQVRKRNTIIKNALDAVLMVKEKNPAADLSQLTAAVDAFIEQAPDWKEQGGVPKDLVIRATEVREKL
jgi:HEAT repeat protein